MCGCFPLPYSNTGSGKDKYKQEHTDGKLASMVSQSKCSKRLTDGYVEIKSSGVEKEPGAKITLEKTYRPFSFIVTQLPWNGKVTENCVKEDNSISCYIYHFKTQCVVSSC